MTQEKNKLTGETKKYYYDAENRMVKYEHLASDVSPIDIMAEYKYDIFGRRLQKNVNGAITNFFWENDTMTYELNEQYQPIRKYITGLGMDDYEGHLEYSEVTDWSAHIFNPQYNPPWYTYMRDQVGTVYKVYDHRNHSIADSRAYDSFGNLVSQTGTTKTPLGFQGKYYDQESGLNYFYHRYYNPAIGRFTSEDPLGFFVSDNFYNFVENNSVNNTDPFGLAIFKNNCDRPIPYKPEETCGTCNKAKKYSCPPGATCDVDGVYPSDGGNPIKIVDGCEAECKDGKLKIICRSLKSLLGQRLIGGPKSDKWMDKHQDWPRPNDPVLPPCQK
jgi:RHS repeat-associated protein